MDNQIEGSKVQKNISNNQKKYIAPKTKSQQQANKVFNNLFGFNTPIKNKPPTPVKPSQAADGYYNFKSLYQNIAKLELYMFQRPISMKIINLSANSVQSIEILYNIQFPFLQQLNLAKNKINSIKTLRKLHLPNIKQIFLNSNNITQFTSLSEFQVINNTCRLEYIKLYNGVSQQVNSAFKLQKSLKTRIPLSFDQLFGIQVKNKFIKDNLIKILQQKQKIQGNILERVTK